MLSAKAKKPVPARRVSRSRKSPESGVDDALRSAVLDLHEPIAEVRPLAELVLCLCQNKEPIPAPVMGLLWRILDKLDADLRRRHEVVGKIVGLPAGAGGEQD